MKGLYVEDKNFAERGGKEKNETAEVKERVRQKMENRKNADFAIYGENVFLAEKRKHLQTVKRQFHNSDVCNILVKNNQH